MKKNSKYEYLYTYVVNLIPIKYIFSHKTSQSILHIIYLKH